MNNTLTWLHLSDLHLTCKSKDKDWTVKSINQDIVIKSLLEAIDDLLIKKGQNPDIIFITGDLVHGGKEDEYQVAEEFCKKLLEITGLNKQSLFIVPGNHDVNREKVTETHIKKWYPFESQDDISEILSDSIMSPVILSKFDGFYQFSNNFFGLDCKPEQHYIIAKPIEIKNTKINLLGLNSALFSGYDKSKERDGDDKQKLAFGLHQIDEALQIDENYLTFAFFHHPFSCFHKCEESIQNQLKTKADLILTGHLHEPSNMSQRDTAGNAVIIGAGASYEKRTSENSFNVGVLDLETGKGKVQFYKFIEKQGNCWTENTDINLREKDNGRFSFEIPNLKERLLKKNSKTKSSRMIK
jgi:predicted phosphodiesterase